MPVNVCFMIDGLRCGGTETQLVSLIRFLDRSRVAPSLVLLDGEDPVSRELEPADIPVLRLGVTSLMSLHALRQGRRLTRFLRDQNVQVLQTHFADSAYLGVPSAKLAGVPYVVKTRRDLCYWMSRKQRALGRPLDVLLNRFLVDAILVNSTACQAAVTRDEGMDPRRVTLIENGIDLARFAARRDAPRNGTAPGAAPRIAAVAMLRPEKRLQDFVQSARRVLAHCPRATFEIAGEGDQRAALEALIVEQGLESRFRLVGRISDVADYLAGVDVAVLCSETESMPNAILEYMAAGKPIVATNVGSIADILQHEQSGLLVKPRDPTYLAAAIVRMLSDETLATRCAAAARTAISDTYRFEVVARRYEEFYRSLSSNNRRGAQG